jgi:HTH-type transcriptional regulator / antitoxin HigA
MEIRQIRTDKDHKAALAKIEACWGAPERSEQGDKLDVLLALVEIYEAKRWPTDITKRFDPIDVLNYAIDELGHSCRVIELTVARIGNSLAPAAAYSRNDS